MATAPKLSFSENMWDSVETIKEKTETGLKSCKDVLDFFRRLAVIEEEYSKNVSSLLQRYPSTSSNMTLTQGWKSVITVLEGQAAAHKNMSVNFTTNLSHPLQALLKDMENRRKQLVIDGIKQKTELKDHTELVKKAKLKYEKSSKDLEAARNELTATKAAINEQDPQSVKIAKLEKNISVKEAEANLSETQYKSQVQVSNTFLDSHQLDKWPFILSEFEQFELTRISFMKANISNFMGLLKELPSVLESEVSAGVRASEQIDPEVDIQLFIQASKTPKELLLPFAFEQYQVGSKASTPSVSRPISQIWDNLRLLGSKEEAKTSSVFGVSLLDLMEKQQKEDPVLQVPKILAILTEGIITLNGLNTEGIFRLAGSASEVQNARKQFERDYSIPTSDVHVLGSILKQLLRELPEAVIPTCFYDECVNNQSTPTDLFEKLPPVHKTVLLYLLNFLQLFIRPAYVQYNKMNASNLSTIFATVLLRSPQKEPSALLAGLTNEFIFVEKLILTAPLLDASQFPIFAVLHQTLKSLPPLPNTTITTTASSQTSSLPTSPPSLTASPTFEVAYSTTTDPSCTSFEDMSSKEDQISDFSETDHFDEVAKEGLARLASEERLASGDALASEGLPEFVLVPTATQHTETEK